MAAAYDKIAESYTATTHRMPARDMLEFAFQQHVGDVAGKSVLDLACGDGTYTKNYRLRGAARVVGFDVSEAMIALARKDEAADPRVEYLVGDARDPGTIGEFDLVTATFLLHYAAHKEELLRMCRRAYDNLTRGGRFVALNQNVLRWHELNGGGYEKYGIGWRLLSEPLREGSTITFFAEVGANRVEFDIHYLTWNTYEWALRTAGFEKFEIHQRMPLSPDLEIQFGREHWQHLLDQPPFIVIECQK